MRPRRLIKRRIDVPCEKGYGIRDGIGVRLPMAAFASQTPHDVEGGNDDPVDAIAGEREGKDD